MNIYVYVDVLYVRVENAARCCKDLAFSEFHGQCAKLVRVRYLYTRYVEMYMYMSSEFGVRAFSRDRFAPETPNTTRARSKQRLYSIRNYIFQ